MRVHRWQQGKSKQAVGKYVLSSDVQKSLVLSKNWTNPSGGTPELQREPCSLEIARDRSIGPQSHIKGLELGSPEVQWDAISRFEAEKQWDRYLCFKRSCWQLLGKWSRQGRHGTKEVEKPRWEQVMVRTRVVATEPNRDRSVCQ